MVAFQVKKVARREHHLGVIFQPMRTHSGPSTIPETLGVRDRYAN